MAPTLAIRSKASLMSFQFRSEPMDRLSSRNTALIQAGMALARQSHRVFPQSFSIGDADEDEGANAGDGMLVNGSLGEWPPVSLNWRAPAGPDPEPGGGDLEFEQSLADDDGAAKGILEGHLPRRPEVEYAAAVSTKSVVELDRLCAQLLSQGVHPTVEQVSAKMRCSHSSAAGGLWSNFCDAGGFLVGWL